MERLEKRADEIIEECGPDDERLDVSSLDSSPKYLHRMNSS